MMPSALVMTANTPSSQLVLAQHMLPQRTPTPLQVKVQVAERKLTAKEQEAKDREAAEELRRMDTDARLQVGWWEGALLAVCCQWPVQQSG